MFWPGLIFSVGNHSSWLSVSRYDHRGRDGFNMTLGSLRLHRGTGDPDPFCGMYPRGWAVSPRGITYSVPYRAFQFVWWPEF